MQQICAEAKMSPGALYRYFASKDSIIEAIAEDERLKVSEVISVFAGPGTIVDRLMRAASEYFAMMMRPGGGELMFEICAESMRNTSVGHRFHCIETDIRAVFTDAIAKAQEAGEVGSDVDVEVAVTMLLAIGDGLAMRISLDPGVDLAKVEPALRRTLTGLLASTGADPGDASGT